MASMVRPDNSAERSAARASLLVLHALLPPFRTFHDWRDGSPIRLARAAAAAGGDVLLMSRDREVRLSPEALEFWLAQSEADLPVSLSADGPTDRQASQGIGCVLRVSPPGREIMEQDLVTDDPLRSIIQGYRSENGER